MTRTEERLTDALGAAASALREDTLRPLTVPERRRHRPGWAAPVAAAASLLLVVGLGVAVADWMPGTRQGPGSPAAAIAPHRYYVEADLSGKTVVRSTATGAVTASVPLPPAPRPVGYGVNAVARARNGSFFVAAFVRGTKGERIYRFRVTGSGQVTGFSPVPGGVLRGNGREVDAMAASPDGSLIAVGVLGTSSAAPPPDQIVVINTTTGVQSVWRGRISGLGSGFSVETLSWTGDGRELVVLGQWCSRRQVADNEVCGGKRTAEVWALNPAPGGGRLDSGRLLLRQSARFPYIVQALISPDGSTITAVTLTGPVKGSHYVSGALPDNLSVVQISVATGRKLRVLYRLHLGPTSQLIGAPDVLTLSADGAGEHWLLDGGISGGSGYDNGFNGWIDRGRLVPLQPRDGYAASEAW